MDETIQRLAEEVTIREHEFHTAPNYELGPTGKRLAEARDALCARVQHPKRKR